MPNRGSSAVTQGLPPGRARYRDTYPSLREAHPRIYVKIRTGGVNASFWALLDTGAHFCLLNETVAGLLRGRLTDGCLLNETVAGLLRGRLTDGLGSFSVRTAYDPAHGELYRHQITLVADEGESLDIDSTVFVPSGWREPCFVGYAGVLDRVLFAVNPRANLFYFGLLA